MDNTRILKIPFIGQDRGNLSFRMTFPYENYKNRNNTNLFISFEDC